MFTSPHLCTPRERIRLNGKPVSEEEFAEGYWEVYRILEEKKDVSSHNTPNLHPLTISS
jgi:folylpolyglutamate synthase